MGRICWLLVETGRICWLLVEMERICWLLVEMERLFWPLVEMEKLFWPLVEMERLRVERRLVNAGQHLPVRRQRVGGTHYVISDGLEERGAAGGRRVGPLPHPRHGGFAATQQARGGACSSNSAAPPTRHGAALAQGARHTSSKLNIIGKISII